MEVSTGGRLQADGSVAVGSGKSDSTGMEGAECGVGFGDAEGEQAVLLVDEVRRCGISSLPFILTMLIHSFIHSFIHRLIHLSQLGNWKCICVLFC